MAISDNTSHLYNLAQPINTLVIGHVVIWILKPWKIPFITLIGTDEEASTLFTTSNELIKLGFIGVSTVRGGFEAVKYEVEQG